MYLLTDSGPTATVMPISPYHFSKDRSSSLCWSDTAAIGFCFQFDKKAIVVAFGSELHIVRLTPRAICSHKATNRVVRSTDLRVFDHN
jgi:hypothetical protein